MNDKGFAVSSVLYAVLICFLMFLGATMAIFSSSNSIVVAANDDIINGRELRVSRVYVTDVCENGNFHGDKYNDNPILIKINSMYGSGTLYWPRDFSSECNGNICVRKSGASLDPEQYKKSVNITEGLSIDVKVKDEKTGDEQSITVKNPCK